MIAVEPPIKDPPRGEHNRNNLSTKDIRQCPKCLFSILLMHFEPLKSRQPLYKRQNGLAPICPLIRGSTVQIL